MKRSFKTKWLEANKICMAKGDATANNLMFERKGNHKMFIELWNRYMSGMAELINYHLSPSGWTLLFKTRSEQDIQRSYMKQRKKSKKADASLTHTDTKRMLSEHFRIFLSQYVRQSNRKLGRSGTKVKQRFTKYLLCDINTYIEEFERIVKRKRPNSQRLKKYQADEKQYDIKREMQEDSIWKVGNRLYNEKVTQVKVVKGMRLLPPQCYILRKFLLNQKPHNPSLENP